MLSQQKRIILFLTACIGLRLLLTYIAKIANKKHLYLLGYIGLIIGLGFAYQYYINKKIGAFGQKAWWNYMRPVHSFLFLSFGIMALQKNKNAYLILLLDTFIGLLAFINHHFM